MSKQKLKPNSENYRPHYVDEDTEKVYLTIQTVSGAMTAPYWVKKYFPGYTCCIVTDDVLQKMFTNETND